MHVDTVAGVLEFFNAIEYIRRNTWRQYHECLLEAGKAVELKLY